VSECTNHVIIHRQMK